MNFNEEIAKKIIENNPDWEVIVCDCFVIAFEKEK
jgi:hypothetical protein